MLLGDGYELRPISDAWDLAGQLVPALPAQCPEHGLAVYCDQGAVYACSVGLYPTTGHHLICEYLVTNPAISPKKRARALRHLVAMSLVYAVAIGKRPFTLNTSPGMRILMERMGIGGAIQGMDVLTCEEWP
jgi:hypothetical protein